MTNLVGLHDREAASFSPSGTWILDTIALSENPQPPTYSEKFSWVVRANWGYGSTGTIPLDLDKQNLYIERLVQYIKNSKNVGYWIIGNEPNLPREWPDGKAIYPVAYASLYRRCRNAAYNEFGTSVLKHKFLIAAAGPWNNQLKYAGNENGDWIKNFTDTLNACDGEWDGVAIHSYTHGYNTDLVTAETFMQPPFQDHHYDFQTYRDYVNVIPDEYWRKEIHLTEANGGPNWRAVGLMPKMAWEINSFNQESPKKKIKNLIFYRWPHYDQGDSYAIQGNLGVEKEYLYTVEQNYQSPVSILPVSSTPSTPSTPPAIPEKLVPGKPVATVQAMVLNVRNVAGVENSKIVGTKKSGDKISILDKQMVGGDPWYKIDDNQWLIGTWVVLDTPVQVTDDWTLAREFTARWEGGFQNFSWDSGNWTGGKVGEGLLVGTNFGISAASYPHLDIPNLTRAQADQIYYRDYWLAAGCDKLAWPLNLIVFDTAINFGVQNALYYLGKSGRNPLAYIGERLHGYRVSAAWPQANAAWTDRTVDLIRLASAPH